MRGAPLRGHWREGAGPSATSCKARRLAEVVELLLVGLQLLLVRLLLRLRLLVLLALLPLLLLLVVLLRGGAGISAAMWLLWQKCKGRRWRFDAVHAGHELMTTHRRKHP